MVKNRSKICWTAIVVAAGSLSGFAVPAANAAAATTSTKACAEGLSSALECYATPQQLFAAITGDQSYLSVQGGGKAVALKYAAAYEASVAKQQKTSAVGGVHPDGYGGQAACTETVNGPCPGNSAPLGIVSQDAGTNVGDVYLFVPGYPYTSSVRCTHDYPDNDYYANKLPKSYYWTDWPGYTSSINCNYAVGYPGNLQQGAGAEGFSMKPFPNSTQAHFTAGIQSISFSNRS